MVDTQMANIESAYSNFTRMKYDFKVFTTDKEDLEKKIGLHQQKTSTVDLEKEEKIVEIEVEKAETNNKETEKINTKRCKCTFKKVCNHEWNVVNENN